MKHKNTSAKNTKAKREEAKVFKEVPHETKEHRKHASSKQVSAVVTKEPKRAPPELSRADSKEPKRVSAQEASGRWEERKKQGMPPGEKAVRPTGADAIDFNLKGADEFFIQQKVEVWEAITSCEMKNHYYLYNDKGLIFMEALEESDCFARWCLGRMRSLTVTFYDGNGKEVMAFTRPFNCCEQRIRVCYPVGTIIGYVYQRSPCQCTPKWEITDPEEKPVLLVTGPWCNVECCDDIHFEVTAADSGEQVGKITKKFYKRMAEVFSDADVFGAHFPKEMPLRSKILLLGATMLIDLMLFENE